jgi:DNA-binding MarR family transcriptional regulator
MAGACVIRRESSSEKEWGYWQMGSHSLRQPRETAEARTPGTKQLTKHEYEILATFRHSLRRLARQTELEARKVGLTPQQYQLLLAIKGYPGREWANISELAEHLQIRHNAVIGLVNRAEARHLVHRVVDAERADRRTVQIHLSPEGENLLRVMAAALAGERRRVRETVEAFAEDEPIAGGKHTKQ